LSKIVKEEHKGARLNDYGTASEGRLDDYRAMWGNVGALMY